VSGLGSLMAGTFSCDPGCPASGDMTTHQQLHNVSSIITFSSWIIAALVAAWHLRGSRFGFWSLSLGVIELGAGLVLATLDDRQANDPVGLMQRVVLLAVGVWFVLAALELRRAPGPS